MELIILGQILQIGSWLAAKNSSKINKDCTNKWLTGSGGKEKSRSWELVVMMHKVPMLTLEGVPHSAVPYSHTLATSTPESRKSIWKKTKWDDWNGTIQNETKEDKRRGNETNWKKMKRRFTFFCSLLVHHFCLFRFHFVWFLFLGHSDSASIELSFLFNCSHFVSLQFVWSGKWLTWVLRIEAFIHPWKEKLLSFWIELNGGGFVPY